MKKFFCNGKKGFCHDNDNCANCEFCDNSGGEYKEVPLTNADRIRAMSDEEMAIMFAMLKADLTRLDRPVRQFSGRDANDNYDWLQQPPEEVYRND